MDLQQQQIVFFQQKILTWHRLENLRRHPWTKEKDPYKIWLSEIIMQQTQIKQGRPYYYRFIEKYPNIHQLAIAKDEDVFRLWQGLGYYNRCRNLLKTARYIDQHCKGIFPDKYKDILALKGVGSYTAAAIASFAYDLPHAVLDGNVFRILARFFALETAIDKSAGKKKFQQLAQNLLPQKDAADYNQAIMDFGATVCKPKTPDCDICPLSAKCQSRDTDLVHLLPIKKKKLTIKKRYFHYFLLCYEGEVYLHKRTGKDIWQNLFELYLIEHRGAFQKHEKWQQIEPFVLDITKNVFKNRQRLTHQLIISRFHIVSLKEKPPFLITESWLSKKDIEQIAFPKTVLEFWKHQEVQRK